MPVRDPCRKFQRLPASRHRGFDPKLVEIVALSLGVSLAATLLAACIGLPLGAAVAVGRFPGRGRADRGAERTDGPAARRRRPLVYLLLSRAGPLGRSGLLFTPKAMVIAQTILITPILAALSRQIVEDAWVEYREQLTLARRRPLQRR